MITRPLHEITADLIDLNTILDDCGGEIPPEAEGRLTAWMDALGAEEGRKLDGFVGWIKELEMQAAAARAEIEQWLMKARVREKRAAWLRDRLKAHLEATGRTRVETERGRVLAIQSNGGAVPVVVDESADLPTEYARVTVTPDVDAIRKALVAGKELPFARLGERGTHLRVK